MTDGLPLAYKGYPGYELKVCTTHEDRVACQDLCFHLYREPSYGVEDPHHVARWLGPLHRFIYVGAWRRRSGCLAGTFRLQKDYNPLGFSNIHDELAEFCRNGHGLVDIGASTFPQGGQQASVFEGLFTLTLKYLLASEIYGVYIQVQP